MKNCPRMLRLNPRAVWVCGIRCLPNSMFAAVGGCDNCSLEWEVPAAVPVVSGRSAAGNTGFGQSAISRNVTIIVYTGGNS